MTEKQWNALKEMTQGMVFECDMSLGKVRLEPEGMYSYLLLYPSHIVTLHRNTDIPSIDRHYLHTMYNNWLSRNLYSKSSYHYSSI